MSKRPSKPSFKDAASNKAAKTASTQRNAKQGEIATNEGNMARLGKLVGVAVLCAASWLICIYWIPLPDAEVDSAETSSTADSLLAPAPAIAPMAVSKLSLPRQSIYAGSEKEKKLLLNDVESAVASFPKNAAFLHIAGLTYAELQQSERAIELLRTALQADPNNQDVCTALADLLLQIGKPEEAVVILEQAISRFRESEPLLSALGESYSQAGLIDKAAATLERAVAKLPPPSETNSSPSRLRLAQAFTQVGRFDEAEKAARDAVLQNPKDLPSFVALANALMRQNKRDEASEVRARMPKGEPNIMADDQKYELSFRGFTSHNYAMLGSAYAALNRLDTAEKFFVRSLEIAPDSHKTVLLLAEMLRRNGRIADAMIAYQRLIEIQPENVLSYHNLASLAVSVHDLPTAEKALRAAVQVDTSGAADIQLAQFLLATGNAKSVVTYAQAAVDKLGTVDAYLVLMDACRAQGDSAASFSAYLKAKKLAPDDPRLANFTP